MDIYGIIGYPIKHSLSPAMHNAAFKKLGIDAEYRKFEVRPKDLKDFILNRKEVVGFNITVPHKVEAEKIIKDKGGSVHRQTDPRYIEFSGAINTVKRDGDIFIYTNTDVSGFMRSLKEDLKFEHKDKNVLLIGCGGAGRAVIAGLTTGDNSCNKLYIYDINNQTIDSAKRFYHGRSCLNKLQFISEEEIPEVIKNCTLLVNASPVGMKEGDGSPIDTGLLHKDLFVYDVVYNRETELIKNAKLLGLNCSGGLGMLLYQGVHAFEFWTGKKAPVEVMKQSLLKNFTFQQ
jgi:shikimate dehydrogenase